MNQVVERVLGECEAGWRGSWRAGHARSQPTLAEQLVTTKKGHQHRCPSAIAGTLGTRAKPLEAYSERALIANSPLIILPLPVLLPSCVSHSVVG